jgi:predicted AAA+ superfamily ATPase
MKRYLDEQLRGDLSRKLVILTGPRQVGKTSLAQALAGELRRRNTSTGMSADDRAMLLRQSWSTTLPACW